MEKIKKFIPMFDWLSTYNKSNLKGDMSAGLTVGVMLIPQGMAYSMLAGLPPIYGLYASILPLILYAIFGTSRQLAVGPVAMVALLISSGVGAIATTGSAHFIALAITLALMVGVIQLLLGLFRLGFLVNFLSHPVISGFTSAAALIIGLSQLKHLLGVNIPRSHHIHEILGNAVNQFGEIHWATLILGVVAMAIIIIIKKVKKSIPGPLVAVIIGTLAVYILGLDAGGMKIVKEVPEGLPAFTVPAFSWADIKALFPIALTISLVGFMESIAVAKAIQSKHKNYDVVPNQELIGLGLANIGGAFFKAFPTTGGFSRTAVNDQAGAKTGMASIISAVLIIITLLFLTPLFYYLPKAILASVIMVAVFGLIDFKEAKHLWKTDRKDFLLLITTFIATLSLGIETGIGIGVGLSLIMVIYNASYPHIAEIGKIKGTNYFKNVNRYEEVELAEDTLIVRVDASLFFGNIGFLQDKLSQLEASKGDKLKKVILNAEAINNIDSSAVHALVDINNSYKERGITFKISGLKGPLRDIIQKSEILEFIGEENFHMTPKEAIEGKADNDKNYALQYGTIQ